MEAIVDDQGQIYNLKTLIQAERCTGPCTLVGAVFHCSLCPSASLSVSASCLCQAASNLNLCLLSLYLYL